MIAVSCVSKIKEWQLPLPFLEDVVVGDDDDPNGSPPTQVFIFVPPPPPWEQCALPGILTTEWGVGGAAMHNFLSKNRKGCGWESIKTTARTKKRSRLNRCGCILSATTFFFELCARVITFRIFVR